MMRSLAAGLAVAVLTVACSDDNDGETAEITFDSGLRDAGGGPPLDGGPLDARALLDARRGDEDDGGFVADGAPPACTRTDELDPNESAESASALPLDENGKAERIGVVHETNADWFQLVAPRFDPLSVTVTYQVPETSTESLQLYVDDAQQIEVASDVSERDTNMQVLAVRFQSVRDGKYFARVVATALDCVDYTLRVDTRVCTDPFEDNDVVSAAAALPAGAQSAIVSSLDQDIYVPASGPGAGSCSVQYTVPMDSKQQLQLGLFDASDAPLAADDTMRSGSAQTLTVSWQAGAAPAYLVVSAAASECTAYVVTCSGPATN